MAELNPNAVTTEPAMPVEAIEWLLVMIARDEQLRHEARTIIKGHHFHPREIALRVMYEAIIRSIDAVGGVTYETLVSYARQFLDENPGIVLTPEQMDILMEPKPSGLFYSAIHSEIDMNDTNRRLARQFLQQFARERTVIEPLRRILRPDMHNGIPSNIEKVLGQVTEQTAKLATLNSLPVVEVAPEVGTDLRPAFEYTLTGIPFIDARIGGQRVGDCNGILGPTGGGKTTLGLHMAAAAIKQSWTEAQISGGTPDAVVFATYEEAGKLLRPRIWSNVFNIRRDKLETLSSWDELTTRDNLEPYEREMQRGQPEMLSELDRYNLYRPALNSSFVLLDLSASDEYPTAGSGFVGELVSYLSRLNRPIRTVFVDYAGLMCERHMRSQGMDDTAYRHLLKTLGDRLRNEVAERFQCTVWALHQLRGDAGKYSPTKLISHHDAGESKDFAVNMAVCMCLGTEDKTTGCRYLNFSKVRYRPNEEIRPVLLRIHRQFGRMVDVTDEYTTSDVGNTFVTIDESQQVRGMDSSPGYGGSTLGAL